MFEELSYLDGRACEMGDILQRNCFEKQGVLKWLESDAGPFVLAGRGLLTSQEIGTRSAPSEGCSIQRTVWTTPRALMLRNS
jgi:hypothetical protein